MNINEKENTRAYTKRAVLGWIFAYLLCFGIFFSPLLWALFLKGVTWWFDCTFSGAGPIPCKAFGTDIGDAIYFQVATPFLMILTAPFGFVFGVIVAVCHYQWWRNIRSANKKR